MAANTGFAQPFDLIIPGTESPDALTKELRNLQAVERDLAVEKLTREPTRLEAYLELGDLRLSQGKLQESQRFYEMALDMSPKNTRAIQGLVMVHYHLGEFNLARDRMDQIDQSQPLSDFSRSELEAYKRHLNPEATLGLSIREDDRGLSEIGSSIEGYFPSSHYPKVSGRYRFDNWSYEDNGVSVSSQLYSGTMNYQADKNTNVAITFAPEIFPGGDSVGGYAIQGLGGTDNLKLALRAGKSTFKENLFTVQNRFSEQTTGFSLFGDLHQRTRVVQSVTLADLSDGNSRRRYDSELIHAIFRNSAPFLTANLRFYQASYEKQSDVSGNLLKYWAPSDYKGAELELSWERSIGAQWWWGLDTNFVANQYRFGTPETSSDSGGGAFVHLSYRFANGNLYASLGDRINEYFRERKLEVYGNFSF